jgi:hypothetical protein
MKHPTIIDFRKWASSNKDVPPLPTDKVFGVNANGEIHETSLTWNDLEKIALHIAIQRGPLPPMPVEKWTKQIEECKKKCNYDPDEFKIKGEGN